MTREEIEQLDDTEPYSFETDREEWWYQIGLKQGLQIADEHPRKGLWDSEKVVEWLKKNCTYTHPRKGTEECFINLFALKDAMED